MCPSVLDRVTDLKTVAANICGSTAASSMGTEKRIGYIRTLSGARQLKGGSHRLSAKQFTPAELAAMLGFELPAGNATSFRRPRV